MRMHPTRLMLAATAALAPCSASHADADARSGPGPIRSVAFLLDSAQAPFGVPTHLTDVDPLSLTAAAITSAPLDLAAAGAAKFVCLARPADEDAAPQLVIEYETEHALWNELRRVGPATIATRTAILVVDALPSDALRDGVRFRLRVEQGGLGAWDFEDVRVVTAPLAIAVTADPDLNPSVFVAPDDVFSEGRGEAPLARFYDRPTEVRVAAAPRRGRAVFERWLVDGRALAAGQAWFTHALRSDVQAVAGYALPGDMNGDGVVNRADLDLFVLALADPDAYCERFPSLDRIVRGDVNDDGAFDDDDIKPFIDVLLGP